jgi:RNA polymerase sigma-70 factor (ECF subfamily)
MIESGADVDAFNGIYEKYKGMMYRVAFSVLKNSQDAEDAVQEAFFKLAKNFSKIDPVSGKKTEAFLVILVRSVSIDIYRKNQRDKGRFELGEDNDMDSAESAVTADILGDIISKDGYERIKRALEGLNPTYKDTMCLRFIFEWNNEEIAKFLGVPKNVVEVRINRGRAMLVKTLEKGGYYADR